jgi:hypothetical protein
VRARAGGDAHLDHGEEGGDEEGEELHGGSRVRVEEDVLLSAVGCSEFASERRV